MDLGGKDIVSVQYQNANNSVRVSDEFMHAVEEGKEFDLLARRTGEVVERIDARTLMRSMAQAAWECADPGIQYDGTINDWHTNPESGRISASNPCLERVYDKAHRWRLCAGRDEEEFAVYTTTYGELTQDRVTANRPVHVTADEISSFASRRRRLVHSGPDLDTNEWVHAEELTAKTRLSAPSTRARPMADNRFPCTRLQASTRRPQAAAGPDKWDRSSPLPGWLVATAASTPRARDRLWLDEDKDVVLPGTMPCSPNNGLRASRACSRTDTQLRVTGRRSASCCTSWACEGRAADKVVRQRFTKPRRRRGRLPARSVRRGRLRRAPDDQRD